VTFAGVALYGPDSGPGLRRVDGGKRVLKQGRRA
jgi:hypothetical protein